MKVSFAFQEGCLTERLKCLKSIPHTMTESTGVFLINIFIIIIINIIIIIIYIVIIIIIIIVIITIHNYYFYHQNYTWRLCSPLYNLLDYCLLSLSSSLSSLLLLLSLGLNKKMFGSYYPTLPSFCPLPSSFFANPTEKWTVPTQR